LHLFKDGIASLIDLTIREITEIVPEISAASFGFSGNLAGLNQAPNVSQPFNASLFENVTQQPIKLNVSSNQDNRDLRGQGYNDGCSDALHGVLSSSLA
jgi:hypothetical protein